MAPVKYKLAPFNVSSQYLKSAAPMFSN